MDWKDAYQKLQKKGYELALPSSEERKAFRSQVLKQHKVNYADSQVRVIYVLGNAEKRSKAFFDDEGLVAKLNKDITDWVRPVKARKPSLQYCAYKHVYCPSPGDLVARRLLAEQLTIEFINVEDHEEHKGVFVMWDDLKSKK